ncbi:MAG TPA: hydrogenase maturation nickel metallochaperone HypA [Thermoplasmata archaeon]|nr:hydrogenase maturation nickel metallochaperone HypA [Thermoplasmata archaeon]
MHEEALLRDLLRSVAEVAARASADRVTCVRLRVGALSHLDGPGIAGRWPIAARGTVAEGARLEIDVDPDPTAPGADRIVLVSLDVPGNDRAPPPGPTRG